MDNFKSNEFTFLFLINKCILLFKYIDINHQKSIFNNIKLFVNKLQEIFSKADFNNSIDRKNKILEFLINYFNSLIDQKIYYLLDESVRDIIISEIELKALENCENNKIKSINKKQYESHNDINQIEIRLDNKIKKIFTDVENNVKKVLKDYFAHTEYVEYDLDKKFDIKLQTNNILIETKIKEYINDYLMNSLKSLLNNDLLNNNIQEHINNLIKSNLNDLYNFIDIFIKKNINSELENKIVTLIDIFNKNIQKVSIDLNERIINNENDLIKILNEKMNIDMFNKNNFTMNFDKDTNEIQLYYFNELITSTKINIKGLIGPRGLTGSKGDTPIIRKINIQDNKLKFIIQDTNNIYEILTEESIPNGPQGIQGPRGESGKSITDIKWNQDSVMRIDQDHKDSLIFLKSLCVGDKSHCLKDNSLAIGGAICYQNNSIALGNKSKTLDNESIAFFGSCLGKKAFSFRADNIDENNVQFGQKDKTLHNINSFNIISKEIVLDCDSFKLKTNNYENNKYKELEERIMLLEKKILKI
jgi:hypothetical protein